MHSVTSNVIISILLVFISATRSHPSYEGDSCTSENGPGVCTMLKDCPLAMEQMTIGKMPEKHCGFSGFDPIVCCSPAQSRRSASLTGDERGGISRAKCLEYSQYVDGAKPIPNYRPVPQFNVSPCGIAAYKLIPGQITADRKEFPHMAAVGYNLNAEGDIGWFCAGALISETFVLTAAHCTNSREFGNATWVRVGDLDLVRTDDGATPEDRRVVERIRNPQYKVSAPYHDIALLRLETRVPFNSWIRPACLYTSLAIQAKKVMVTGWARHGSDDERWSEQRKVNVPMVDSQTCTTRWTQGTNYRFPNGIVNDWSICAGGIDTGNCLGGSGEPLIMYSKHFCMYELIGVSSLENLCRTEIPVIYNRVYNYIPWIESVVWGKV